MAKRGSTIGLEKSLLHTYRKNISRRNPPLPFELTYEQFSELIHSDCYLCGASPGNIRMRYRYNGKSQAILKYNGIDRLDNTVGYLVGNVRPCCSKCNSVKGSWDLEALRAHLKRMLIGLESL